MTLGDVLVIVYLALVVAFVARQWTQAAAPQLERYEEGEREERFERAA